MEGSSPRRRAGDDTSRGTALSPLCLNSCREATAVVHGAETEIANRGSRMIGVERESIGVAIQES